MNDINELEELRKAYGSLNDIARNLKDAITSLKKRDVKMAMAHPSTAQWHTDQARKSIAAVGEARKK
jgi:hypothetical protein